MTSAALDLPDAPDPVIAQNTGAKNIPAQGQSDGQNQTNEQKKLAQQPTEPSLSDLGFSPTQTEANAKLQARLNKRTHMLKVHQTLGLITLAPLVATVAVSGGAKEKHVHNADGTTTTTVIPPSDAGIDLHAALGSTTALMYGLTTYYAIAAPKIKGVKPRGAIRLHRDLVWVHLPGMVLTPILGSLALDQEEKGEKVHGIASAHGAVAIVTLGAYAAAAVSVSWPIHIRF
ncbi:MAG TPA: hypothetical protein VHZ09_08315 [Acidobacteriaceae bacterium]|nr:hypothetical protein [Acidobacteriaceae bacterium]